VSVIFKERNEHRYGKGDMIFILIFIMKIEESRKYVGYFQWLMIDKKIKTAKSHEYLYQA
jgi:hypothetical protein